MTHADPTNTRLSRGGTIATIIVAGGQGRRYGGLKQYASLAGRRVLDHAIAAARRASDVVVLVVPPHLASHPEPGVDRVVAGGSTRSASVRAGLATLEDDAKGDVEVVVVHDAVRPLATDALFERVIAAVRAGADASVPGIGVVDTLRRVDGAPLGLDRDDLVAVQTPQAFAAPILWRVHTDPAAEATDDASLVSAAGGNVEIVEGERQNLKITAAIDLVVAEALVGRAPTAPDTTPVSDAPEPVGAAHREVTP